MARGGHWEGPGLQLAAVNAIAKSQEELQKKKKKKKITQIPLKYILYFEFISIFPFPHPILHTHSAALLGSESFLLLFLSVSHLAQSFQVTTAQSPVLKTLESSWILSCCQAQAVAGMSSQPDGLEIYLANSFNK